MSDQDPVEFRLIANDLVTQLAILPSMGGHIYFEMNAAGSGAIEIPLDSTSAALAEEGQFIACYYRGALRGGWFVDNIAEEQVRAGENGGRVMSLTGRGAMGLLDRAIIQDNGGTETTREFTAQPKGAIFKTLLDEAIARGGLAVLSYDFTDTLDSDGAAWTDSENYKLNVGMSLLDLVKQFAETGIDFAMELSGGMFILHAYLTPIGTDISDTIKFRVGRNCVEVYSDLRGGGEVKNALRIKYRGGYISVEDAVSIAARGRREKLVSLEMAQTPASATTVGAAMLESSKDPKKQISVKITDSTGARAFVDYDMGDTIGLDVLGVENSYRVLGMQCTFENNIFADVIVDLNSLLYENDLRMASDIDWLLNQWNTANDSDLIEVTFWAAIGTFEESMVRVNVMHKIGNVLYIGGTQGVENASVFGSYNLVTGVWTSLPNYSSFIYCMDSLGTDLYIGLGQGTGLPCVYKYDTLTDLMTMVGNTTGVIKTGDIAYCTSMKIVGTDLYIYAAGADDADGTTIDGMAIWDTVGEVWSAWGSGANSFVWAMENIGTDLYIGGAFTNVDAVPCNRVAVWNGSTFAALDTGLDGNVYALKAYGTNLLAGGAFTDGLAEWDGLAWAVVGGGTAGTVYGIDVYLTDIYIVGDFTDLGNYIAKYSGGFWDGLSNGMDDIGRCIYLNNQDVYVGGEFTHVDFDSKEVKYMAAYFTNFDSVLDYLENSGQFDMGAAIHNAPAAAIVDASEVPFWDAITRKLRKITWANIKTTLQAVFMDLSTTQTAAGVKTFSDHVATGQAAPAAGTTGYIQQTGADGVSVAHVLWTFGTAVSSFMSGIISRGTKASPTAALTGDIMLKLRGRAHDGSGFGNTSAEIRVGVLSEDHAAGAHGTQVEIWTTPNTTTTLTKVFTIQNDGNVNIETGKTYNIGGVPFTGGISGTGTTGQLAKWTGATTIGDAAIIPPASNIVTLTATAASTLALNITAGKTLTLTAVDNYTLTIPATGTAAMLGTANVFTAVQKIDTNSTTAFFVEQDGVKDNTFIVDTTNGRVGINKVPDSSFEVFSPTSKFFAITSAGAAFQLLGARGTISTPTQTQAFDTLGSFEFYGHDNASTYFRQAGLFAFSQVAVTSSTYSGQMEFRVTTNTAQETYLSLYSRLMVFNENSVAGMNVRLESNDNDSQFYLGGTGNFITIGSQTEIAQLGVIGVRDEIQFGVNGFTTQTSPLVKFIDNTAATAVIRDVLQLETQSTGTAATGLGAGLLFSLETATAGTMQSAGRVYASWVTATNATRAAKLSLSAFDTSERLGIEVEASGTVVKLGFFGVATVVRPTALTTQLTTLTHTAPATPDYAIQDFVDVSLAAGWAFASHDEANSVIKVIANLQTRVSELETKLQGLGLLT